MVTYHEAGFDGVMTPKTIMWDFEQLYEKPEYQTAAGYSAEGLEAIYIDNEPYRGKKTRVFAWMGLPQLLDGEQCPAMVLLHGGGGTAFDEWVSLWNARGYAAICIDQCGCQPQNPPLGGAPTLKIPMEGRPDGTNQFFRSMSR